MTTEQQAREALKWLHECAGMHNEYATNAAMHAHTIENFITKVVAHKAKLELYSSLASKYEELRALIDNGHESYTHEDAVFRVTEDRRIADAVRRHGVRTYAGRVYDCNLGHDGALIEETLPESMIGNVLILPADAVGGG